MGELPLWHKQKFGIGAALLPMSRKSLCLPRETAGWAMLDPTHEDVREGADWAVGYDSNRTNAGLDIIAGYARNCGKRPLLTATKILLSGSEPVLCAIRENIRETGGADACAVVDTNGAKEIDCYV